MEIVRMTEVFLMWVFLAVICGPLLVVILAIIIAGIGEAIYEAKYGERGYFIEDSPGPSRMYTDAEWDIVEKSLLGLDKRADLD